MKQFFGYIRVSTPKQGEHGVSLPEQRSAIEQYAARNGLTVIEWFEERKTAAKRGRAEFSRMLALLRRKKAEGVIIHKIDRSARNLRDWADLGDLIDCGVEVHFANESLDLASRGGRLSADIQAVVASDFIRNLRQETLKGMYGRLKQGLLPFRAPLGYLDCGGGVPKEIDPARGPLIRRLFELYSTGKHSLKTLLVEATALGLVNHGGKQITINGLSTILNNPFYVGLIRLEKSGEVFQGIHTPLIPKRLFDRVQDILHGRVHARPHKHAFIFRRLLTCAACKYSLTGERQKGHIYYRCHHCATSCIREEAVEQAFMSKLQAIRFDDRDLSYVEAKMAELGADFTRKLDFERQALQVRLGSIQSRLDRLTDAYIFEKALDRDAFEERKRDLLLERAEVTEKLDTLETRPDATVLRIKEFFELIRMAQSLYKMANPEKKREMVLKLTSNRVVDRKSPYFTLRSPYLEAANRRKSHDGDPSPDVVRMEDTSTNELDKAIEAIVTWFIANPHPET